MDNFDIINILNKMERASEFIKCKEDVEELADRIFSIQRLLNKFEGLEELMKHLQQIEKYIYVGKSLLTIEEAAKYMCVSKSFVYKLTSSRELRTYRPSGKVLYINKTDLNAWMMQNMQVTEQDLQEFARNKIAEMAQEKGFAKRNYK